MVDVRSMPEENTKDPNSSLASRTREYRADLRNSMSSRWAIWLTARRLKQACAACEDNMRRWPKRNFLDNPPFEAICTGGAESRKSPTRKRAEHFRGLYQSDS